MSFYCNPGSAPLPMYQKLIHNVHHTMPSVMCPVSHIRCHLSFKRTANIFEKKTALCFISFLILVFWPVTTIGLHRMIVQKLFEFVKSELIKLTSNNNLTENISSQCTKSTYWLIATAVSVEVLGVCFKWIWQRAKGRVFPGKDDCTRDSWNISTDSKHLL